MAETSALCFTSSFSTISRNFHHISPSNIHHHHQQRFFFLPSFSSRFLRFAPKASHGDHFEFGYGSYPWDPLSGDSDSDIQWVREERITMFTADGLIQLGGSLIPRRISSSAKKQGKVKVPPRHQRFQESDYMDPKQSLCLGALFDIAATNVGIFKIYKALIWVEGFASLVFVVQLKCLVMLSRTVSWSKVERLLQQKKQRRVDCRRSLV